MVGSSEYGYDSSASIAARVAQSVQLTSLRAGLGFTSQQV
jgi:hypothetical protein